MIKKAIITLFQSLIFILSSNNLYSQSEIRGRVVDAISKKPIPQAEISVYFLCGVLNKGITNLNGYFAIKTSRAFIVDIVCSKKRYKTQVIQNFRTSENSVGFVNIFLGKGKNLNNAIIEIDTLEYEDPFNYITKLLSFEYIINKPKCTDTCNCVKSVYKATNLASNSEIKNSYDSIVILCNQYFIACIGNCSFCKYVSEPIKVTPMYSSGNDFVIQYSFVLPQQFPTYIQGKSTNESISIDFTFNVKKDGNLEIHIPINIPDCSESPQCGFIITKLQAEKLAKENNFIASTDKYLIESNGIEWVLRKLTTTGEERLRINMKTGALSKIEIAHRID